MWPWRADVLARGRPTAPWSPRLRRGHHLYWPGRVLSSPEGLAAPATPSRYPLVLARGATPGTPDRAAAAAQGTGRSGGRPAGVPSAAPGERARRTEAEPAR